MDINTFIESKKIVPVIVLEDAARAEGLGKTLMDAQLPIAEVTLRTPAALESIRILSDKFPDLLVGAGTVLTVEDLKKAHQAGAKFAVSPCLDEEVVKESLKMNLPIFPGITNPTDAWKAIKLGLECVKFFPAEAAGGIPMIKSMASVFPQLRFVPTGGINASNAADYLALPAVLAVGGSWIVDKKLINAGDWSEISSRISQAL